MFACQRDQTMSDEKSPDKPTHSARVMLFLILTAVIVLIALTTYTCVERAPTAKRGSAGPLVPEDSLPR